jgi:nucleosome binding factor SPN SPT16 subunit
MYDPDELEEEQKERKLRKQLNETFQEFCKKVRECSCDVFCKCVSVC